MSVSMQAFATEQQIRFRFAPKKALAAIHWMVAKAPGLDLHTMLKTCYLADKSQLNEWGQPVFGATYRAFRFGPVPLEIYEMAKGESLWLAELGLNSYPWRLAGFRLELNSNDDPEPDAISESDMQALQDAFSTCRGMTFDARTSLTHGQDWQAARLGTMRYEDMLVDAPDKAERIAYLLESAPFMAL